MALCKPVIIDATGKEIPFESVEELSNKFDNLISGSIDYQGMEFRLSEFDTEEKINTTKALNYLKHIFGESYSINITSHAKQIGNKYAHGYFTKAGIYIWQNAEIGTEYHEAFHGVFNLFTSEQDRRNLINEAIGKWGNPTKESISELTKLYPKLNESQIKDLAVEEMIAEKFRDYAVLKDKSDIPTKILNFFKDLVLYIKSLIFNKPSIDSYFANLKTGRVNKTLLRTNSKFETGPLYSLKGSLTSSAQGHIEDALVSSALTILNDFKVNNIEYSLTDLLKGVYTNFQTKRDNLKEEIAKHPEDKRLIGLLDLHNKILSASMWASKLSPEGNVIEEGWDVVLLKKLKHYGYNISPRKIFKVLLAGNEARLKVKDEVLDMFYKEDIEDMEGGQEIEDVAEKIYGKSHLEESVYDKLPQKLKQAFSRIVDVEKSAKNVFGATCYYPMEKVYNNLAYVLAGKLDYNKQKDAVRTAAIYNPILAETIKIIEEFNPQVKAQFYTNFAMVYNQFVTEQYSKKNNVGEIKIFATDQNSYGKREVEKWKLASRTTKKGLYKFDDTVGLTFNPEGVSVVNEFISDSNADSIYNFLVTLGVQLKKEDYNKFLKNGIFYNKAHYKENTLVALLESGALTNGITLQSLAKWIISKQGVTESNKIDVYTEYSGVFNSIANNITKLFSDSGSLSFVGADKKMQYPINMAKVIDRKFIRLQEGINDNNNIYKNDLRYVIPNHPEYDSYYYKMFAKKEGKNFRDVFNWQVLGGVEDKTKNEEHTLEDIAKPEGLAHRIRMYVNNGASISNMVMRTFGGRNLQVIVTVPKEDNRTKMLEVFKAELVQEIKHIRKIKSEVLTLPFEDLSLNYHLRKKNDRGESVNKDNYTDESFLGNGTKLGMMSFLEHPANEILIKAIDKLTTDKEYADTNILIEAVESEAFNKLFIKAVDQYCYTRTTDVIHTLKNANLEKKLGIPDTLNVEEFEANLFDTVYKFIMADILFQNEINKFTAIDYNVYKNHEDYSKRMDLLGTPAKLPYIKQDDGDIGMDKTFTGLYFSDIGINEGENDLLNEGIDKYYDFLIKKETDKDKKEKLKEKANWLKSAYKKANGTDAAAYCTIDFWIKLKGGFGELDPEYQEAYNNYKSTGEWIDDSGHIPPIVPEKTSYDGELLMNGSTVTRVTMKHGMTPLFKSMAKTHKILNEMYDRMNLEGKYAVGAELNKDGKLSPIDVINSESTNKGTLYKVNDLENITDHSKLDVLTFNSADFGRPQAIPTKHHEVPLLASQFIKNIVANLSPDAIYNVGKRDKNVIITGNQLKQLVENTVETILENSKNKLEDRLGIPTLLEAINAWSIGTEAENKEELLTNLSKAKYEFVKNIKDALAAQTDTRDLSDNYKRLLDIGFNKLGVAEFENPLYFPSYIEKISQMLTSLYKNNVMKQRINGTSAVQIAELGGHVEDTSGNLKMPIYTVKYDEDGNKLYDFIEPAEIAISWEAAERLGYKVGDIIKNKHYELTGIGYRIPNGGKNMMMPLRIKYILPKGQSTAVLVPKGITVQMGSDFDIDKLYLMFPNVSTRPDGNITPITFNPTELLKDEKVNKEYLQKLSKKQLENIIISLSQSVLTNPYHYEEMMSPLDSDTLPDLVKALKKKYRDSGIAYLESKIKETQETIQGAEKYPLIYKYQEEIQNLKKGSLDRHDVNTEEELRERSVVGNVLIGISANNTTALDIGEGLGFKVSSEYVIGVNRRTKNKEGEEIITTEYFQDLYGRYNSDVNDHEDYIAKGRYPQGGSLVATTHSENLSSGTDNVKNPMAYMLNDNGFTSYVKTFLTQLGMGNNLPGEFLTQPIIRELYQYKLSNPSATAFDCCQEVGQKYDKDFKLNTKDKEILLDITELEKHNTLYLDSADPKAVSFQLKCLNEFYHMNTIGQAITKTNKVFNADRISDMSGYGPIQEFLQIINEVRSEDFSVIGMNEYFENEQNVKQIGYIKHGIERAENLLNMLLPYGERGVQEIKSLIADSLGKTYLNADQHKVVERSLFHYLITMKGSPFSKFNNKEYFEKLFKGSESIVERVKAVQTKYTTSMNGINLSTNNLLQNLQPHPGNYKPDNILKRIKFINNAIMLDAQPADFQKDFYDLYRHPEEEVRNLADDIVNAMIFNSGFNQSPDTLVHIIPIEYWQEKGYMNFIKQKQTLFTQSGIWNSVVVSIIQNNVDTLVDKVKAKDEGGKMVVNHNTKGFRNFDNGKVKNFVYKHDNIADKNLLFYSNGKIDADAKLTYYQIPTKGIKYQFLEYNTGEFESWIPKNNTIFKYDKDAGIKLDVQKINYLSSQEVRNLESSKQYIENIIKFENSLTDEQKEQLKKDVKEKILNQKC